MTTLLIFAVVLFVGVLISELANRSIISTAVLFLAAGFLASDGVFNLIHIEPADPIVHQLAELALFSVLFTDGMRTSMRDLASAWRLPGRALLFGLPLTVLGTALLCHFVGHFGWLESFLIGAILSPTDPVFASAIIGREEIPQRLRHLLNAESGINDGLALPAVLIFVSMSTDRSPGISTLGLELLLGVVTGIGVPWITCKLSNASFFAVAKSHEPLFVIAVALLVLALSYHFHCNLYLAAFFAGATFATVRPDLKQGFTKFGELIAELLKLAALLVFGALISLDFLSQVGWPSVVTAVLILLIARPVAIEISLIGSKMSWQERITVGWFGPKGFASAIYGLLLYSFVVPNADALFHLIAVVIAASIVAHSSTDVPLAAWYKRCQHGQAQSSQ